MPGVWASGPLPRQEFGKTQGRFIASGELFVGRLLISPQHIAASRLAHGTTREVHQQLHLPSAKNVAAQGPADQFLYELIELGKHFHGTLTTST